MIHTLSIHGLRGFGALKTIPFALPDGKNPGSGLTILVGSNNSGKTTIMEALRSFSCEHNQPPSFSERKRNLNCENGKVFLDLSDTDENIFSIKTSPRGGSSTILLKNNSDVICEEDWDTPDIFNLQSRRFIEYEFYQNHLDRKGYIRNLLNNQHNRSAVLFDFSARLFKMFERKESFNSILAKILGNDIDWTIEQNDSGSFYLKIFSNGHEHSSEGMGDGIWSIFTLCDALYDSEPGSVIAIDEPELSLHPIYQKKMLHLIKEYSRDRQIIISTHSPYFVDLESLSTGAALCRTTRDENGNIDICTVDDRARKIIEKLLKNILNPHSFGLEAREIFFLEDRIILVEGQEDVVMYNRAANQLSLPINGNFFGWGAGGAKNIPLILSLFKKLGYKHIAVIYDGDQQSEKEQTEQEFPEYMFFIIPTEDIRDKKDKTGKLIKVGLMDSGGILKEEQREYMAELLNDINTYLRADFS